ncbi:MAG: O-antigen ligase family protein [Spirulina sp. DLM2.Bin59]|nr:MAG: O-antigen ligase family protein [Spirulina sp. DLM2.Bin59]
MFRLSFTRERAIAIIELIFALVGVFFFCKGFTEMGRSINTLFRYGVFLASCIFLAMRWRMVAYTLVGDIPLFLLHIVAFCSFAWSDLPAVTNLQVREILYMFSFSVYLASRYSLREQTMLLAWTLEIAALMSAFYAVVLPAEGQEQGKFAGAWKGIYPQKNELSTMMTLAAAAHLPLIFDPKYNRIWAAAGLGLSLFMILMTTSKSGLIIFIVLVISFFISRTIRWRNLAMVMIFSTLIGLSIPSTIIFVTNWDPIIIGLGRDPTLTGRTDIWGYSFTRIAERPWLGYGRGVFWNPRSKYPAEAGMAVVGVPPVNLMSVTYAPPHSHNGVVDILLEVGFVGLGLFILSFLLMVLRLVKRIYITNTPEEFFPIVFLTFFLMYNFTESLMMRGENIFWIYYTAIAYSLRLGGQEVIEEPRILPRPEPPVEQPKALSRGR